MNATPHTTTRMITYRKACDCLAPSTAGQIRMAHKYEAGVLKFVANFYAGPSCDKCFTPWEEVGPQIVK